MVLNDRVISPLKNQGMMPYICRWQQLGSLPPDSDVQDEQVRSTENEMKFNFSPLTVYNSGTVYIFTDGGE